MLLNLVMQICDFFSSKTIPGTLYKVLKIIFYPMFFSKFNQNHTECAFCIFYSFF